MKKYFAVSDVHSFYKDLEIALYRKKFDLTNAEHILIVCGDAFDRGDESLRMFHFLQHLANENRLVYVRGNHEDLINDLVHDIQKRKPIGRHHLSNGTVKTVSDIIGCCLYDILSTSFEWKTFDETVLPFIEFINSNSIDYFELGKTVFVHGWVPTTCDENKTMIVHENWRDGDWSQARWDNGMELHHFDICPPDVDTIVCGHWHTSFGWSKYKNKGSEWNDDAKFDPYIDTSETNKKIVAIDACTAWTRDVNCVVFDCDGNIIQI